MTTTPLPPPGFDALSISEQIEYLQSLWERIAADPAKVPVPDWHREILKERLASLRDRPESGVPWHEVRERIEEKLRGRRSDP